MVIVTYKETITETMRTLLWRKWNLGCGLFQIQFARISGNYQNSIFFQFCMAQIIYFRRSQRFVISSQVRFVMDLFSRKIVFLGNVLVGIFVNIAAIIAIVYGRLYKQKSFTFVLNLFISNLLFCSIGTPISTSSVFLPTSQRGSMCPFSGFLVYSLSGITYWSIALVSINRYVFIVHFTHFDAIFSPRKTGIILVVTWLYYPIVFSLPMTEIWGRYDFVANRELCTPFTSNDGFRIYVLVSTVLFTALPIAFCYIAILWKVKKTLNQVNIADREMSRRQRSEKQLVQSVVVMITVYVFLHIPFIVTTLFDPTLRKFSAWIHFFALYLVMLSYWVNTLTYSLMNQQIKKSIQKLLKNIFKAKETHQSK